MFIGQFTRRLHRPDSKEHLEIQLIMSRPAKYLFLQFVSYKPTI